MKTRTTFGRFTALLLPLLAAVAASCASDSEEYHVRGRVTLNGEGIGGVPMLLSFEASDESGDGLLGPGEQEDATRTTSSGEYEFSFYSTARPFPQTAVTIEYDAWAIYDTTTTFVRFDVERVVQRDFSEESRVRVVDYNVTSFGPQGLEFFMSDPLDGSTYAAREVIRFSSVAFLRDAHAFLHDYSTATIFTSSLDGQIGQGLFARTLSSGQHTIVASITIDTVGQTWSASDTATITVLEPVTGTEPPVVTIQAPVDGAQYIIGEDVELRGTATDPEDGPLSGRALVWTSSRLGVIWEGSPATWRTRVQGSLRDMYLGVHTITLSAIDSDGAIGSASMDISIVDPPGNQVPMVLFESPADGEVFTFGDSIHFSSDAFDPEDGTLDHDALVWTSSLDGQIGMGLVETRTDLSIGTHTITFTATDPDGGSASASVDITVAPPFTGGCVDYNLRLFADSDTIPVVPGQAGQVEIGVENRVAGFTGAVALMLVPGAGGDQPHEVLYQHAFEPNPVTYLNGDLEFSTLTFTAHLNGLSVGETFDIDVAGASPHHEAVPPEDWCRLPVTFMVFGS